MDHQQTVILPPGPEFELIVVVFNEFPKISFSSSGRSTTVFISSHTKNLDKTLSLLEEKLFRNL